MCQSCCSSVFQELNLYMVLRLPVTSKMDLLNSGMSHQPQFNFVCALVSFEVFEFADDELLHVSCMSCT